MAKNKNKKKTQIKTIENRKARFDYEILETLEVGIKLQGSEVKSVRDGRVSLAEGYVRVCDDPPGLYMHSVNIADYPPAPGSHIPTQTRTLLAHKREIIKLARKVQAKGVTIVPLRMYFKNNYAKVLIGVGRGKAKYDKRTAIANRQSKRELDRALKQAR